MITGRAGRVARRVTRFVVADRLKNHIEVVRGSKPCTDRRRIKLTRAEVVQDQRLVVEQTFDVHEFPRPIELPESALAELKVPGAVSRAEFESRDLVGGRQAQALRAGASR
jgi:hypothetical protein